MHSILTAMLLLAASGLPASGEEPVTFRSDVSLVRVDVRVSDRTNRPVTGLAAGDFALWDNGEIQPVRGFASEEMPLDVLFLIDVSASMQPHVERLGNASRRALATLHDDDRVAVMVFDRGTRLRLTLTPNLEAAGRDLASLIDREGFNGGTDITRGLLDAARYIGRSGRKEARRAIIILTDDQTERDRDEPRVGRALRDADAMLSALIAPDAMRWRTGGGGGGGRLPGGGWGDIIFGPRLPGGGWPGPGSGGRSRTRPAGTSEIARASGGDSLPVDHASALQETLDGIRQRYSLYFQVPPGARPGEQRQLNVELAGGAQRQYPGASLRFRGEYRAPGGEGAPPADPPETVVVSQQTGPEAPAPTPSAVDTGRGMPAPDPARRPRSETYGSRGPNPALGGGQDGGSPRDATVGVAPAGTGGWRRASEEEARLAEAEAEAVLKTQSKKGKQ